MPMSDEEFEEFVERGRLGIQAELDKARISNKMTQKCNGRADCKAPGHYSICLSLKK
jgi:hypothetical protein